METLRIFISSPGDVAEERERARQVVQGLRRRYTRHVQLMPIFWEDLPLSVDASFQEGIDVVLSRDRGVDIAVFVLWSRMGSPLGRRIRRQDGREYRSGTERELDLMLTARRLNGGQRPHILAYTRQDDAAFAESLRGRPRAEQDELLRQKKVVEEFIREEFYDATTGANVRAYHTFARPQSFAERLRVHLEEILDGLCAGMPARPVWDVDERGPPFRGLESFTFEHAEIFFGREDEVAEARTRLGEAARRGMAFMVIGGASGTGKSSLAAAGLLPEIVAHETDESVGRWLHAEFTPAALLGDPAAGMARILVAAVPTLRDHAAEADFAAALAADPDLAVKLVLLPALEAAARPGAGGVRLILLVDQLEELFNDPRLGDRERDAFAKILEALATSGAAWVVATLRGDWYPHVLACPGLVALKAAGAQLDLVPPGADAVRRMIEAPASMAGLSFERSGTTSLADRILRDVADRAELLPLLEDLLRELFERRSPEGMLTAAAYESLGGIEGALATRAEATLASLPVEAQMALPQVLRRLVATGDGADAAPVRRRAPLAAFPPGSAARELVERLVAGRLATATTREDGMPEVTVAHEALLRAWPRAAAWIRENAEFLRVRDRLVARMRDGAPLTATDPLLPAARAVLQAQRDALEPDLAGYLERQLATIDADRRRRVRTRRTVVAGLSALAAAASITAASALWQWRAASLAQARAERARQTAVSSRKAAEGLVEFMTFTLRDKLEPIGRLDLMEDVVEKLDSYHTERIRLEDAGDEEVTLEDLRNRGAFFSNLGDLAIVMGDIDAARGHFQRCLAIMETLTKRDPENAVWRQNLSIIHERLGTLASETGDLDAAREHFEQRLAIMKILAAEQPDNAAWRRDLAVCHDMLGDLASDRGDLDAALDHYERQFAIAERLVATNPRNVLWRWDLMAGHENLGLHASATDDPDAAREHYESALTILETILAVDPRNTESQRAQAAIHDRLGDLAGALEDVAGARRHAAACLEIMETLVAREPRNWRWRRDLAVSLIRLGDVARKTNELGTARGHYEQALEIETRLAEQDPRNFVCQHDLAVLHERLGRIAHAERAWGEARDWFGEALAIADRIFAESRVADATSFRVGVLRRLAECQRELGEDEEAAACDRRIRDLESAPNTATPADDAARGGRQADDAAEP